PEQRKKLDRALAESLADVPANDGRDLGVDLGRFVAGKILALRGGDGSNRAKADYQPRPAPGVWVRTPSRYQEALYPKWGLVTAFAIKPGTQYKPAAPPPLHSAAYAAAFHQVHALGGKNSVRRTEEQTQIALFWADNAGTATPPGHWNAIAQTVA